MISMYPLFTTAGVTAVPSGYAMHFDNAQITDAYPQAPLTFAKACLDDIISYALDQGRPMSTKERLILSHPSPAGKNVAWNAQHPFSLEEAHALSALYYSWLSTRLEAVNDEFLAAGIKAEIDEEFE